MLDVAELVENIELTENKVLIDNAPLVTTLFGEINVIGSHVFSVGID